MISFDETVRLVRIQEKLRRCTYNALRKDGYHKSSEGNIELSFTLPPVVGDETSPYWAVEVYSYLFCPDGRTGTFVGQSAAEAISKAEDAVSKWCFAEEMEIFGREFGFDEGRPQELEGVEQ